MTKQRAYQIIRFYMTENIEKPRSMKGGRTLFEVKTFMRIGLVGLANYIHNSSLDPIEAGNEYLTKLEKCWYTAHPKKTEMFEFEAKAVGEVMSVMEDIYD